MKKIILTLLLFSVMGVAGCGQKQQAHTEVQESSSVKKPQARSFMSEKKDEPLWSNQKAEKLKQFIGEWETTLGQTYDSYSPTNNVNYYGIKYPNELASDTTAVDDQKVSAEWSEDGKGSADYEVVAVYSDVRTNHSMGKHLYLFAIHDGKPVALITMQNQGAPDHLYHFKPTENQKLADGFRKIVQGR